MDFHLKRTCAIHNMGYFKGSLYHPLQCMTPQAEKILKKKYALSRKAARQKLSGNRLACRHAIRDQFNNPGYAAYEGGQGDVMPNLPGTSGEGGV